MEKSIPNLLLAGIVATGAYAEDRTDDTADLVRSNVLSTDLTALVKINRITRTGPKSGYATWNYEAKVIKLLHGPEVESLSFKQTVEVDMPVRVPSKLQIVSLCGSAKKGYYIPDNGFMLSADKHLELSAEQAANERVGTGKSKVN